VSPPKRTNRVPNYDVPTTSSHMEVHVSSRDGVTCHDDSKILREWYMTPHGCHVSLHVSHDGDATCHTNLQIQQRPVGKICATYQWYDTMCHAMW
jgi:hypothetical protein